MTRANHRNERGLTPEQELAVEAFAICGTKAQAAAAAGVTYRCLHKWEDEDEPFKAAMWEARNRHNQKLEDKLFELAMALKPGQNCTALIFALNGAMPEKYRPGTHLPSTVAAELIKKLEGMGGVKAAAAAKPDKVQQDEAEMELSGLSARTAAEIDDILRAAQVAGDKGDK